VERYFLTSPRRGNGKCEHLIGQVSRPFKFGKAFKLIVRQVAEGGSFRKKHALCRDFPPPVVSLTSLRSSAGSVHVVTIPHSGSLAARDLARANDLYNGPKAQDLLKRFFSVSAVVSVGIESIRNREKRGAGFKRIIVPQLHKPHC
jgi:hypothetical protein